MGRTVQNLALPHRIVSAGAENGIRGAVRPPAQLTLDVLGGTLYGEQRGAVAREQLLDLLLRNRNLYGGYRRSA